MMARGELTVGRRGGHYAHSLDGFLHIVHPKDGRSLLQGDGVEHGGAVKGRLGGTSHELPYHALAGYTHEQWQLKRLQALHLSVDFIILFHGFAEAEARVEDYIFHASVTQLLHFVGESDEHVVKIGLDRHQYVGTFQLSYHVEHALGLVNGRIDYARYAALAHVVDNVGAPLLNATSGHSGPIGVDTDGQMGHFPAHDFQRLTQPADRKSTRLNSSHAK